MSVTDEAFDAGWQSGPMATFRLMKLCYPYLKGGGSIINLGSTAAMRWDYAYYGTYACVKEAIRSLTRAAACEWARDGIRINTILPCGDSPALMSWMGTAIAADRHAPNQPAQQGAARRTSAASRCCCAPSRRATLPARASQSTAARPICSG
jgi:NAD(P)-dependent dehydrogenase (short-subunit alcohol dehydrogenase family)